MKKITFFLSLTAWLLLLVCHNTATAQQSEAPDIQIPRLKMPEFKVEMPTGSTMSANEWAAYKEEELYRLQIGFLDKHPEMWQQLSTQDRKIMETRRSVRAEMEQPNSHNTSNQKTPVTINTNKRTSDDEVVQKIQIVPTSYNPLKDYEEKQLREERRQKNWQTAGKILAGTAVVAGAIVAGTAIVLCSAFESSPTCRQRSRLSGCSFESPRSYFNSCRPRRNSCGW